MNNAVLTAFDAPSYVAFQVIALKVRTAGIKQGRVQD